MYYVIGKIWIGKEYWSYWCGYTFGAKARAIKYPTFEAACEGSCEFQRLPDEVAEKYWIEIVKEVDNEGNCAIVKE